MYKKNPYYFDVLNSDNLIYKARIRMNNCTITNEQIKKIKYDLNINDGEKFTIGGAHGATITATLLNFEGELDDIKFENKDLKIDLKLSLEDLYTVAKFNKELVGIINTLKIKHITSLWIPQGVFYATEIKKNENKTITIKMQDKTKYLEDEYICSLKPPFTLKQLYNDVHKYFQIISETTSFYNENAIIKTIPEGYTGKEILGYIAECACGFYLINRQGNGYIGTYGTEKVKNIEKGSYSRFVPAENYINIQKIKYGGNTIIGANTGYMLEINEKNPFITDAVAQNILLKMQGFTYITYEYKASIADIAMDVGDMFEITNTNNINYLTFIMGNVWEFDGSVTQNWTAKGESEINNTYSSKGPINKQLFEINNELEDISNNQIPSAYEQAVEKATELLSQFNGGYVIKKDGELYIADNEDIDKAQHVWRWNINGLGYSSTGVNGPYGTAITMNGQIVADYIATGTMSAERIKGGTLKLGGESNTNGYLEVLDSSGNKLVTISKDGLVLSNGTKLVGNGGVLSNLQFNSFGVSENWSDEKKAGEYNMLGFVDSTITGTDKYNIYIDAVIPDKFTIVSAYITLRHIPYFVSMQDGTNVYGYARNIKCYVGDVEGAICVAGFEKSEYAPQLDGISFSEISKCFNTTNNNFNPTAPTEKNYNVQEIVTNNIASQITKKTRIKIATTNSIPSTTKACFQQTGFVFAQLNVYGYLQ